MRYIFRSNIKAFNHRNLIFPTDLVNHKIYIGNQNQVIIYFYSQALNFDILDHLRITHIINATNHIPNKYEDRGMGNYFI